MKNLTECVRQGFRQFYCLVFRHNKDEQGSGAYAEDGIVPQAIRYIKKNYKELVVVADVCLCEYTSHGHCGLICDGEVLNDETLPFLSKASVVYAKAGNIIAPSDMMDKRVTRKV